MYKLAYMIVMFLLIAAICYIMPQSCDKSQHSEDALVLNHKLSLNN